MGCGCGGEASSCGCGQKASKCGCAEKHRRGGGPDRAPIGVRQAGGVDGTERTAPGIQASTRTRRTVEAPIGTRSAVPVPDGFDGLGGLRMPVAAMVQRMFGASDALTQQEAARLMELIPTARLAAVMTILMQQPPEYRLDRLRELAETEAASVTPDPVVAVSALRTSLAKTPRVWSPEPTAPSDVCLVNGFDPRWGAPPSAYAEIPLRFDSTKGWYDFDRIDAARRAPRTPFGQPTWDPVEYDRLAGAYDQFFVLQPYRRAMGSPWEFRWIQRIDRGRMCVATPAQRGPM